ncbi:MAG TPA: Mth938-like domain-containing protein [Rhodospirillales bacterium]|nr:Mth938-like domain-containing protein [Rhodospirillales bacterium]
MTVDYQKSPRIADCSWGHLSIERYGSLMDAKLYPGGARAWDWRETGTRHDPGIQPADVAELVDHGANVVVLSTGVFRCLGVCPETLLLLKDKGVSFHVLPTPEAVAEYNRLAETRAVGALIHSTC